MSELKAGVLVTPHNEGMCFHQSSAVIAVTEGETEFYLKSEADKVIAELKSDITDLRDDKKLTDAILDERNAEIAELKADYKEACDRLQTANLIKDEQLAATRHSNYKRCLAMAKACHEKSERMYCEASSLKTLNEILGKEPKDAVVEKFELWGAIASTHRKRWIALAEKFKETDK